VTRDTNVVEIGGIPVGDGHPTVFMAEVGAFFNKDIGLALDYLRAARDAGVDVFKTEVLHDPDVCLKGTGVAYAYRHGQGSSTEDLRAIIERKVVPLSGYARLFSECRRLGIPYVCSVFDVEGIDFLTDEGCAGIKFSRDNLDNLGLIRHAARTGIPLFFDAGNVYLDELARAVRAARESGAAGVIVNLHPAANPAPAALHHLRLCSTYKKMFEAPVGLACHYRGDEILYAAVGCGVNILEKGIDQDPDRPELDLVSAEPLARLKHTVQKVRACWEALGGEVPVVREPRDKTFWRGMAAKRDIAAGEVFSLGNVGFCMPPLGLAAGHWDLVEGQKARRAIPKGRPIGWSDVEIL